MKQRIKNLWYPFPIFLILIPDPLILATEKTNNSFILNPNPLILATEKALMIASSIATCHIKETTTIEPAQHSVDRFQQAIGPINPQSNDPAASPSAE